MGAGPVTSDRNYWSSARRRRISRRAMLGASAKAGIGAAALALAGCGDDDDTLVLLLPEEEEADEAAAEDGDQVEEAIEEAVPRRIGGPNPGGKLTLTWAQSNSGGFNPYISITSSDHLGYLGYLYDSVLGFDNQGRIQPELAESWELPDDLTYVFNLRPGTIFQDGAPVDAHAMQANMDYVLETPDIAGLSTARAGVSKAVSREVINDLSWRMVNAEPFAPTLVNFFSSPGTGMLISPAHFETAASDPVGAGPLRQTGYHEGENWTAERWDGYWDEANVWVDEVEQVIVSDGNSQWNAFLAGDVSWAAPPGGMTKRLQEDLVDDGYQVLTGSARTWQQTWFNIDPSREPEISLFRDPRLRRAVHLAIDRAAINEIATENLGKASRGPVSQESWALLPDKDYYADAPNLEESYQLRDAAGYADGVPGVYLSFATEFHRRMAEPVHNQLREAGFDLEFLENTEAVIIEWMLGTEEWQMAVLTWESPFDPDPVLRNSISALMSWQYGGEPGRSDPALHPDDEVLQALEGSRQLVEAAAVGPSQDDRLPHYDALFQNWTDNGWNYHIAQYSAGWAGQPNLRGFEFRDVDGWIVGDGVKYLWFDT
ncbi:MAG: ABC transporter substrate-binding protein [Chloroflexi bacterium]|nr:ABC transporter substrate-binding protein [Chloroflexota bacterium]